MGIPDNNVKTGMSNLFDDTGLIATGIRNSSDILQAVERFADFVETWIGSLLFFGGVEAEFRDRQRILYSKFSNDINAWLQFSEAESNPLRFCASHKSWQIPNSELEPTDSIDLFESKLKLELNRKGLRQSNGVTVKFGSIHFVFIVGNNTGTIGDDRIEKLKIACASFITGLSVKFPLRDVFESTEITRTATRKDSVITERQRQCLEWIASGKTSFEISIILGLSEHTVNNYINDACKRLGAVSRIQAVVIALQSDLIELPVAIS